ncbi:MAG: hypothetical protein US69_C0013G0015 [candidate division TM6 bacterium GW2011_GWF2_38_10]|nr:MAG: hypothetical protein US69_C0013G0015 [candidate division TM6 bacterium GW2011_GWF2_38_10]
MNKYTIFLSLLLCNTIPNNAIAMFTHPKPNLEEKTPQQAQADLFYYVKLSGNPFEAFINILPTLEKFNDNPEFDINKTNVLSQTLLEVATVHAVIKRLTKQDECCDCDSNNNESLCPCLKIIEYLLTYGANPNIPGSRGLTPLQIAIQYSHLNNAHIRNIIKLLLQHGADTSNINWREVPREITNHESILPFLPANAQTLSTETCLLF